MRTSSTHVPDAVKHRKMLEVLEQFRILFKSVRRHYGEVQLRAGIGGAQVWALSHIEAHPGIKPGELARALAIHPSTASNLVGELEQLRLITRQRQKTNQRVVELCATSKGLRILKRAPRPLIGVLQQGLSDQSVADLQALHRYLGKLVASMKSKNSKARAIPLSKIL